MVQVFLNGQFVPEEHAVVSVFDRSFLYGDGLFETILVRNRTPFRWQQHLQRLQRGADFLKIVLPFSARELGEAVDQLFERNNAVDGLVRLTLSRGVGVRGYSPQGAHRPTLVMSLHAAPAEMSSRLLNRWKLITASLRLPANDPVAQFKTCNKLAQVLARGEADAAAAQEALLINTDGFVVEAASSNLFWLEDEVVCTAPLMSGILAGVTRAVVLELCQSLQIPTRESNVTPEQLKQSNGVFLSLSSLGIVAGESLDGVALASDKRIQAIHSAYCDLVHRETMRSRD